MHVGHLALNMLTNPISEQLRLFFLYRSDIPSQKVIKRWCDGSIFFIYISLFILPFCIVAGSIFPFHLLLFPSCLRNDFLMHSFLFVEFLVCPLFCLLYSRPSSQVLMLVRHFPHLLWYKANNM